MSNSIYANMNKAQLEAVIINASKCIQFVLSSNQQNKDVANYVNIISKAGAYLNSLDRNKRSIIEAIRNFAIYKTAQDKLNPTIAKLQTDEKLLEIDIIFIDLALTEMQHIAETETEIKVYEMLRLEVLANKF